MKRMILALAIAATTALTFAPQDAEARGRGFGVRVGFGGFQHHRIHRGFYAPVVYSSYDGYCRWYRTAYGPVKRCFY